MNWREFLKRPDISEAEWGEALALAGAWKTCATGMSAAEKGVGNMPVDLKLYNLGLDFYQPIKDKDRTKALTIVDKIEARITKLNEK